MPIKLIVRVKGGAGSGNWGHAGRPGLVGGSGGSGGGMQWLGGDAHAKFLDTLEVGSHVTVEGRSGVIATVDYLHSRGRCAIQWDDDQISVTFVNNNLIQPYGTQESVSPSALYDLEGLDVLVNTVAGCQVSYLVDVPGRGNVIVKPELGDIAGSIAAEVAAYEVDKVLGFGLVPETVLTEHDGKAVSVQEWVHDAREGDSWDFDGSQGGDTRMDERQWGRMALFDYAIGNIDRTGYNWLHKDGKPIAIDHGAAFVTKMGPRAYDYSTYSASELSRNAALWSMHAGRRLQFNSSDLRAVRQLPRNAQLKVYITESLGDDAWDAMVERVETLR